MCIALIKAWGLVVNIGTEKGAFSLVTEQHVSFQWCRIIIIIIIGGPHQPPGIPVG